nr:class I SAM-dependent methyltransferase [Candidatus Sigynarchaeum springense]
MVLPESRTRAAEVRDLYGDPVTLMDYKDYLSGQIKDNFWSMAKRDLIEMLLDRYTRDMPRDSPVQILNVGAGVGDDLKVIRAFGAVHVVDIDPRALQLIPEGLCQEKRIADVVDLPYSEGSFDVVTCFDVFEHVKDDKMAMREVDRVLKEGGLMIFTVPAYQALYSSHDRVLQHERRYDYPDMIHRLAGFTIVFISYWNCILSIPVAIKRLLRRKSMPSADIVSFSRPQNLFLFFLMHLENRLLKCGVKLPFGTSIVGACRKPKKEFPTGFPID